MRGHQQQTKGLASSNLEICKYKGSLGSCPRVLRVSFSCFSQVLLSIRLQSKSIKNLTYKDRLIRLKLPTLKYRCIRGDVIEVYKILTNKYDNRVNLNLEKQQDSITRSHSLKIVNNRYHYDLRNFSFHPEL